LNEARHRAKRAGDRVEAAERHLHHLRTKEPDNLRAIARAEHRLKEARDRQNEANARANKLTRIHNDLLRFGAKAAYREAIRELKAHKDGLKENISVLRDQLRELRHTQGADAEVAAKSAELRGKLNDLKETNKDLKRTFHDAGVEVGDRFKRQLRSIGPVFRNAKGDVVDMGRAVKTTMQGASSDVAKSVTKSDRLLARQFAQYGMPQIGKAVLQNARKQKGGEVPRRQAGGDVRLPHAQMGMQVPGQGSGDKVMLNALVEPGERVFVLNRNASQQLGGLMQLNAMFPRFKAGGGMVALGTQLQRQGYEVGEHPAFGGVTPGAHVPGSLHYQGRAFDINDDTRPYASGGGEPGSLDRLYNRLKGTEGIVELLWRVADHYDHLHVGFAPGFRGVGLGAGQIKLPRWHAAAHAYRGDAAGLNVAMAVMEKWGNKKLNRAGPLEGGEGQGAYSAGELSRLWARTGRSGDPGLMGRIGYAESTGNPRAVSYAGARGLWQIMPGTWSDFGRGSFNLAFNPVANARTAHKVYESQGLNAWDAYRFGMVQKGGLIQQLAGGGEVNTGGTRAPDHNYSPIHIGHSTFKPFTAPWLYERRQRPRLQRMDKKQGRMREQIDLATRHASWPSSAWGEETSPRERNHLIGLNRDLLKSLNHERRVVQRVMRGWKHDLRKKSTSKAEKTWIKHHLGGMRSRLRGLEGVTGRGGEIFDVREVIATLQGERRAAQDEAAFQQVAYGRERYDLFNNFGSNLMGIAGAMAGPRGGIQHRPVTATASGGSIVPGSSAGTQASGGKTVNNTVTNYYLKQPEDPHTWSKQTQFELQAMG
jgi:hypothetical protein